MPPIFPLFQTTTARLIAIDYVVLALYFAVIFAIGWYHSRKERTTADYFLASRDVAWWAIGASLFSSNIGSEHFIGLAGSGASTGMAAGHFEWLASLMVLTLGWVFVPFYLRSNVYTMPEFLERRYNGACRTYLAGISLIAYVFTKIAVAIFAGAIVLKAVLGWGMVKSSLALVIATGIYTVAGGLAAVIYTEVIQTVILVVGALVLMFIGLDQVGGWAGLQAKVPADFFHMMKPSSDASFPWTGIFFGAPILGIWYWCTDQVIVQRVLSAKDIGHARAGTVVAGFLKILPVFMLIVPGMIARALYPQEMTADSNAAFPLLVVRLMPAGLQGVMVAAMLAALMSSLSAVFNSSSTIFTMDFYKKFKPLASERELVNIGRLATVLMIVLSLSWIPYIDRVSSQLWIYLQSVQAYVSPPIAAVFLFGLFWKRINAQGAIASLLTGFVLGAARFILEVVYAGQPLTGFLDFYVRMNFLHFAVLMFVICLIVLITVSLITPAPAAGKVAGLTFQTVKEKLAMADAGQGGVLEISVEAETAGQRKINQIFACVLIAAIISLWIYFA
ncbi:MAG TPA: sodium:solute symporter [Blastocatellia bacterium]|nr:sodium:solute symporter [Blastocatellia bacterium]HMV86266.1 sodium:solute symporter [Blastocatellia bacterium]HMY71501.1 sodium:solute symporter [Blastocatellia bacterium]HMZ18534.1 sodium:solute symporter [Blastocatellia bacterium]